MKSIVFPFFLLFGFHLSAQNCSAPTSYEYLDINNFKATLSNGGGLWLNSDLSPGYGFQINNQIEDSQIYSGGLMLSGLSTSNGNLHFAGTRFQIGDGDFWAGPILGMDERLSVQECALWDRHFKINKEEIDDFKMMNFPLLWSEVPPRIRDWPAKGNAYLENLGMTLNNDYAPFFDFNANQIYDPQNGDYPLIKGDQAVYWIYNDYEGPYHFDFGGRKIGAEIQVMAYAYLQIPQLLYSTFYDYKIINRSDQSYSDFYIGHFIDVDNLDTNDDMIGVDTLNQYVFTYNDIDSTYDSRNVVLSNAFVCLPNSEFDKINYTVIKNNFNLFDDDIVFRSLQL